MSPHLSKREEEVLYLILKGCALQEIADKLCRTIKHIQGLKANIRRKWSVQTDVQIAFEAIRRGYISVPKKDLEKTQIPVSNSMSTITYIYTYKESISKTIKITIDE